MSEPTQEELRERLRAVGLRATPARVTVLRHLFQHAAPLTHAELVEALDGQGWDRATLYRNLTDLTDASLVKRTDIGDHLWRYELIFPESAHSAALHPHFLCTVCGDISCLPDGALSLAEDPRLPRSMRAGKVELQVRGPCDKCV